MRISRFFVDVPLTPEMSIELPPEAVRHAVNVLRLPVGATLILFNGDGKDYIAQITQIEKKQVLVDILEQRAEQVESPLKITLIQVISRGERMEYALQKAVELGVTSIMPVTSERCGVTLKGERRDKKHAHWQGVLRSACEQSGRNVLPDLHPQQTFEQAVSHVRQADAPLLLLSPDADQSLKEFTLSAPEIAVAIGPEGGFSDSEIALVERLGGQTVRFGPRILRTETAAVAVLTALQFAWGDLG